MKWEKKAILEAVSLFTRQETRLFSSDLFRCTQGVPAETALLVRN